MPVAVPGRRAVAALLALTVTCAAAGLVGCGETGGQPSGQVGTDSITRGISQDVDRLRSLTPSTASQLFDSAFTSQLADAGIDASAVYAPLFKDLQVSVDGVDVSADGTSAVAHLSVTNKDLASAFAAYQSALTDELSSTQGRATLSSMTNDDAAFTRYLVDKLAEAVGSSSLADVTSQVDVTYALEGGSWVAGDDAELSALRKALLGGLDATALATAASAAQAQVAAGTAAQPASEAQVAAEPAAEETQVPADAGADADPAAAVAAETPAA